MKLSVILIVLAILLVFSCSKKNDNGKVTQQISFLHYFSGNLSGGINELVNSFNENYKPLILTATPLDHESFKSSILSTLKEGSPPDIYSYWAGARVESVLYDLAPIDDIWTQQKLDSVFSAGLAENACTYEGKKYLIPITQHYVCFFYNKKIFTDLKLTPPQNWEELLKTAEKIKSSRRYPFILGAKSRWPAQFWFDYLLLRTVPSGWRNDLFKGKHQYHDPEIQKVFKLWHDLMKKEYFYPGSNQLEWDTDAVQKFVDGEAAMMLMGTWITGILNAPPYNLKESEDYDYFSFPVINQEIPVAALGPVDGLVIPKKALNIQGAKKALVYFSGEDPQKLMSRGSGAFSPNIRIPDEFYPPMHQRILREIKTCPVWAFNYDLAASPAEAEKGLNLFREFLEFPDYYPDLLKNMDTRELPDN